MLLKGLASRPITGLKKEEKKIVCRSIMERHQDRAINKRRDITCRPQDLVVRPSCGMCNSVCLRGEANVTLTPVDL